MSFVPVSDPALTLIAARSMLDRLDAMAARVDGVRRADDDEHVHQMRVASRRLRAALREFAPEFPRAAVKSWTRTVRRVTKGLGPARDLDVQIGVVEAALANAAPGSDRTHGLRRLLLRLRQERERTQKKVDRAMDALEGSSLFDDLGGVLRHILTQARLDGTSDHGPAVYERARRSVRARVESLLSYETFVSQPERAAELHQMRIEAKRLRYTLELFAPAYDGSLDSHVKRVKKIQTLLGDLHDCDVWIGFLPEFLRRERRRIEDFHGSTRGYARIRRGIEGLLADRVERRGETYEAFREAWNALERAGEWERLLDAVLRSPCSEEDDGRSEAEPDNVRRLDRGRTDAGSGPS